MKRTRLRTQTQLTGSTIVKLFPRGILVHPGSQRPVLLLKSKDELMTLPVWMNPLDAGLGLSVLSSSETATPHHVGLTLLKKLGLKKLSCQFIRVQGHHQFVKIDAAVDPISGQPKISIECRADSAMSFCLAHSSDFSASVDVIHSSRILNDEIDELGESLRTGLVSQAFPLLDVSSKKSGYLM